MFRAQWAAVVAWASQHHRRFILYFLMTTLTKGGFMPLMTVASVSQFHVYLPWVNVCLNSVLNLKGLVGAFNKENLRDWVIFTNLRIASFQALPGGQLRWWSSYLDKDCAATTSLLEAVKWCFATNPWHRSALCIWCVRAAASSHLAATGGGAANKSTLTSIRLV